MKWRRKSLDVFYINTTKVVYSRIKFFANINSFFFLVGGKS